MIIIVLSIIPVIIWLLMAPLSGRFADLPSIFTSLGQVFGLVGIMLFSINLILAGRLKVIDRYFRGLDKVYEKHAQMGQLAFSLILLHPIFLVVRYLTFSVKSAVLFFVSFVSIPVTFGILSLVLMIALISLTIYFKLKYHVWKFSHKFMTLAFALGAIHTFLIQSDISRNIFLKYYVLLFVVIGLVISIRQSFFSKFSKKQLKYNIVNIKNLKSNVVEIEMSPLGGSLNFKPGQFAFFRFLSEGVSSESHPFSLSSSYLNTNLKITVKDLGDFTKDLGKLKVGEEVLVSGPYGAFSNNSENKNQIWIAGGIGITPFFSMAQTLSGDYNVDFYYSVKSESEAIYKDELEEIVKNKSNFKFKLWDSSRNGFINSDAVTKLSHEVLGKEIFICGPLNFMQSLEKQFIALGVDRGQIHYENFSF